MNNQVRLSVMGTSKNALSPRDPKLLRWGQLLPGRRIARSPDRCTYCLDGMYAASPKAPTVGAGAKCSHRKITIFSDAH